MRDSIEKIASILDDEDAGNDDLRDACVLLVDGLRYYDGRQMELCGEVLCGEMDFKSIGGQVEGLVCTLLVGHVSKHISAAGEEF